MLVALATSSWNSRQLWICLHQHRCTHFRHFENCLLHKIIRININNNIVDNGKTKIEHNNPILTIIIFSEKAISPFLSRQQFIMINVAIKIFCKHTRTFFRFYNLNKK